MQTKNKIILIFFFTINFFLISINLYADEFNIVAKEISIDKKKNILTGVGSVIVTDMDGNIIKANKVIYDKSKEFLTAIGSVVVIDVDGNILTSEKITYNKLNEVMNTFKSTKVNLQNKYTLITTNIKYELKNKIISSNQNSILNDIDGNTVELSMFQYQVDKNLLSSIGNTKITDKEKNIYRLKEFYIDTKKKEMIGSDVNISFDNNILGNNENEPRLASNNIFLSKDKSKMYKGVFTPCKSRGKDKCPPWTLQAKEISHDKAKKTIYYDNAILKLYNIPIFYFPMFFHPDPTVKRQSGFLNPFFSNSSIVGTGIGVPYYWMIGHDRDLTFTTKMYDDGNPLFLNEYRQAFKNGFLTLDMSHMQEPSNNKITSKGSRGHIFADLDFELENESNFSIKVERVNNDEYFRVNDINTSLVDSSETNLVNNIKYSYNKNNTSLDISSAVYEDLRKTNDRYEFIIPNVLFGKTFFTEKTGTFNFTSDAVYKNYDADKYQTMLTNQVIWNSDSKITKSGFINTLEGIVKNMNYKSQKTTDFKTNGTINELRSVLSYKSSLPLKKKGINFTKIFKPNFMLRYAPGHMRSLDGENTILSYTNVYSANKTSVIENGLSAVLGFDFTINEKSKSKEDTDREKLSLSLAQIFNRRENFDMPAKSSLDQKTSDLVGVFDYNFSEIGSVGYKFSLDHNYRTLNYNQISSSLNLGKVDFELDYIEQRKHIGTEHYIKPKISLNMNDNNTLSYSSKKNYKTDSTELYDISYQYQIDCLKAGLTFRREFYKDSVANQKESLMFNITFVPFGGELKAKNKISD